MSQNRIDRSGNQSDSYMLQNIDSNFDDLFDVVQSLDVDFTFDAITGVQPILNSSPNGALNVPTGLFEFECLFDITNMSGSSGSFGFALGGSATLDSQKWMSVASKATDATEVNPTVTYNVAANTALTGNNANTVAWAHIRGVFRVSGGGTIIPQVTFTNAGVISTIKKNSFFRVKKLNQNYKASIIQPPTPRPSVNTPFWS